MLSGVLCLGRAGARRTVTVEATWMDSLPSLRYSDLYF
jgi:hypothetical protein